MLTLIGALLIVAPFVFVARFEDKRFGFFVVTLTVLLFHTSIAFTTQMLGVFTYPVVLSSNALALIALTTFFFARDHGFSRFYHSFKKIRIDWVLIAIFLIALSNLYYVHFNYSGLISTAATNDLTEVQNHTYAYPYFADEWYAAAFAKQMIETRSLTFANPINPDKPFLNAQAPFHALIAEFFLLLDLDPVSQYGALALLFSCFSILVLYLFLIGSGVATLPAGVASLSTLYIVQGGVLPGLWTLFPLTVGALSLLTGLFFIAQNSVRMSVLSVIAITVFYPPLLLFYMAALLAHYIRHHSIKESLRVGTYLSLYIIAAGVILAFVSRMGTGSWSSVGAFVLSKLHFSSFWAPSLLHAPIYLVLPVAVLLLLPLGLWSSWRKHTALFAAWSVGMVLWLVYSFTTERVLIEFERVILVTSYLSILVAGVGLHWATAKIQEHASSLRTLVPGVLVVALLGMFTAAPWYTAHDGWLRFKVIIDAEQETSLPSTSPVTAYLTPDDLRLFESLESGNVLTIPWKGTVLGVATKHVPLSIKSGTISRDPFLFYDFMLSSCEEKNAMAQEYSIRYVYSAPFDCDPFTLMHTSKEDLMLYEYNSQ